MKRMALMIACSLIGATPARAEPDRPSSSVRYALIVGNNHGRTPPGLVLPDLKHAEDEAERLRDALIELGSFDPAAGRVVLVRGGDRQAVLEAAAALAERRRQDRELLGDVPTLFAFFYTGHGLEGELLTAGEPLTGVDLSGIFERMGATFTVGVFDACFSGSLDLDSLRAKGLRTTPGFNAFESLPREVLSSKGTMWFTSSQPDQVSYEDDAIGGVFTHYFIEGLRRARADRFGVTLDEIWEYARSRTQRYTSRTGRPQTPQKMVRNLQTSGPLYFSFPTRRSAALVFDAPVEGQFLLRYESGQLTELVTKPAGAVLRVPVYPGEVLLERVGSLGRERQLVELRAGADVRVRPGEGWQPETAPGSREVALVAKGGRIEGLLLTERERAWSGLLEFDYRVAFGPEYGAVTLHNGAVGLRVDTGWLSLRLAVPYGRHEADHEAWGYTLDRTGLRLEAGPAFDLGGFRLGLGLGGGFLYRAAAFRDGTSRAAFGLELGGALSVLYPVWRGPVDLFLHLRVGLNAERAPPVVPAGVGAEWSLIPSLEAGVSVGIF